MDMADKTTVKYWEASLGFKHGFLISRQAKEHTLIEKLTHHVEHMKAKAVGYAQVDIPKSLVLKDLSRQFFVEYAPQLWPDTQRFWLTLQPEYPRHLHYSNNVDRQM
jgi:hypothetical protein